MTLNTLGELLDAGVHFGHQSSRWNPKMFPYIYDERNGLHILDLVQTEELLKEACSFVADKAKQNKLIIDELYKPYLTGIVSIPFSLSSSISFISRILLRPNNVNIHGR